MKAMHFILSFPSPLCALAAVDFCFGGAKNRRNNGVAPHEGNVLDPGLSQRSLLQDRRRQQATRHTAATQWQRNGNATVTQRQHNGNTTATQWQRNGNTTATPRQLSGNRTATQRQHHGNSVATQWQHNGITTAQPTFLSKREKS